MTVNDAIEAVYTFLTTTGLRIMLAVALLFVSFRLIGVLFRRIERRLRRKPLDQTVARAVIGGGRIAAKSLVVLLLLGFVGLDTGSLAAVLASLGVGAGLAVNGALSNAAGGVLLLLYRPFRLDDYIEVAGFEGVVEEIRLVTTRLSTIDNRTVHIPNGTIVSETIVNYSEKPIRRLDLDFSLPASVSPEQVRSLLLLAAQDEPRTLPSPPPFAVVTARGGDGLTMSLRLYVKNEEYWDARFALLEETAKRLTAAGIPPAGKRIDLADSH